MGCPLRKQLPNPTTKFDKTKGTTSDVQPIHPYDPNPEQPPPRVPSRRSRQTEPPPPVRPPRDPKPRLPASRITTDLSCVQLHVPIYVAIRSGNDTGYSNLSFEEGDEMELIEELKHSNSLRVKHLRSGQRGTVHERDVELDPDTPLRLAVDDRGIIEQCLMMYDTIGAYLIRRSGQSPKNYLLSIFQENKYGKSVIVHHLIGVNLLNQCFYFENDKTLQCSFKAFQQLIADERVRNIIPMTVIMPYAFEQNPWQIPFNQLKFEDRLGSGAFGEVWRAQWRKSEKTTLTVAVKKLHIDGMTNTNLEQETVAMKALRHLYVVSLFGVADDPMTQQSLLITEFMENGDLKSYLKRLPTLPEFSTLLRFSKDIASGMAFLELRNYAHRDLACRNLLLNAQATTVKIADFGLSALVKNTDEEQRRKARSEKLPFRWSAPEIHEDPSAFSLKSDVWSYGIVLIEIWSKGDDPYPGQHAQWIISAVPAGFVHERPSECPMKFYTLVIERCLAFKPENRPRFATLAKELHRWQK